MSFLHVHKRRVPTQDVYRSVVVGMRAEAAMLAKEDRLALTACPVHGSAGRAGLRGVSRIDGDERAAPFFQLVSKVGGEAAPALIENLPVEAGFLPDVPARSIGCSSRRCRHAGDAQVLHYDDAEAPGDGAAGLVMPVAPDAGALGGQPGASLYRPEPAPRSLLAPRHDTLCGTVASLDGFKIGRNGQHLAGGERQRISNASIYPDARADVDGRDMLDFAGEGYMPAERVERHCDVKQSAFHRAGVAELHPTDLRQADGGPLSIQPAGLDLSALKAERIVDALPARRRIASAPGEEIGESLVEVTQRLLLAGLRDGSDPVVFGSEDREITGLSDVVQAATGLSLIMPPPVAPLLKGQIVDQAAHTRELPEQPFLLGGRGQLVAKGAMHVHVDVLHAFAQKFNTRRERAFLPGLNAGVSSTKTR